MKKIIIFPGDVNGVFFKNEFPYIQENFDEGLIITYPTKKIPNFEHFECVQANGKKISLLLRSKFWKWFLKKEVKEEIKQNFSLSIKGVKKLLYILMYGIFYIDSEKQVKRFYNNLKNGDTLVVYSFWMTRGAYAAVCINEAFNKKTNNVYTRTHRYDLYEERNSLQYLPFRKSILEGCKKIYPISENGKKYIEKKYEKYLYKSLVEVKKLGSFNDNKQKKLLKKNKVVIASCSGIIEIKRLDKIIDLLENLEIDFLWIHLGNGNLENEIRKYAAKKLEREKYKFLGYIENCEILNIYEKYDVDFFINMSDSEGIPVSIMEAISMGIPVIARDVGGIQEIINENTGYLCSNLESEFNQIQRFIGQRIYSPEMYFSLSQKAKSFWQSNYNAENNYNKFFIELAGGGDS